MFPLSMSSRHQSISRIKSIITAVQPLQGIQSWATLSGLTLALLLWNWTLFLSLAIAVISGVVIYLHQERRLNLKWLRRSRAWKHHQSLWIALLSSGGIFSVTYGLTHLWQASDAPWLATGALLQGFGTLAVLGFLVWDKAQNRALPNSPNVTPQQRPFQDLLDDLTDANAMIRLLAIHQIAGRAITPSTSVPDDGSVVWSPIDIQHCLQLMKKHEPEPIVRQAIEEAIARIHPRDVNRPRLSKTPPQLQASQSAFTIPNLLRTRTKRVEPPQSLAKKQSVLISHP